jgi:molybdopterin/thiamine biosynthesis adenylyltransferase
MSHLSMFFEHVYQNNPQTYKPFLFKIENEDEKVRLHDWLKVNQQVYFFDSINAQIKDFIKLKNPTKKLTEKEYEQEIKIYLNGRDTDYVGNWCYYHWNKTLIHILPEDDFIEVRTNRNKLKITEQEQNILKQKTIGIIGLSVGQSIALTMVMERICGSIKLADFDELDLSNLNRLRTGLHNIGVKKTFIAAREIAEIDPYINVEVFSDGITDQNMDKFFTNLDLLVEVCDSLDMKMKSRLKARELTIPVVMDTNDRGMIDIERFDLEPSREILHGLICETDINEMHNQTPQQRLAFVSKIISLENTSDRLKKSMAEINNTIVSWPQLASSVVLGGAATTDISRRILLKQTSNSGRYYIDFDEIIK